MSEVDSAQMLVKTGHIDAWQQRRADIALYWVKRLKEHAHIRCLIDSSNWANHSFHKFVIDVDNRDILAQNLALRGIETRVHYRHPLHELPAYTGYEQPSLLSVASALSRRVLSLPLYPELTDLEVEYVIDQVLDCA
jgi:dTDP-4-amino-4,6-dideoxygalactose transaminase